MQDQISLYELWIIFRKRFVVFGLIFVLSVAAGKIYNYFIPDIYRAQSTIFPIEENTAGVGLGAMGAVAQLAGIPVGGGAFAKQQKLVLHLKSPTFARRVVTKYDLFTFFFADQASKNLTTKEKIKQAQGYLSKILRVLPSPEGQTIDIIVESISPEISFTTNEHILKEFEGFLRDEEMTKTKKNRQFIGKLLKENSRDLMEIGKKIAAFNQQNQTSAISSTLDVPYEHLSPVYKRSASDYKNNGDIVDKHIVKDVPQQTYIEYIMLQKQIMINLETLLSQQYEMARIEEQKEHASYQVVNEPEFPDAPFELKKRIIFYVSLLIGLVGGLSGAFAIEIWYRSRKAYFSGLEKSVA